MNSSLPFDSTPVAPTMAYSKRKKVLMENQLDLNENELDYYEDIVNDLAEKLEKMTQEKEDLQSVSSSLGGRLKIVNEEKNKILAESEKRIDSLEKVHCLNSYFILFYFIFFDDFLLGTSNIRRGPNQNCFACDETL